MANGGQGQGDDVARCKECGQPMAVRHVERRGTGMSGRLTTKAEFYCAACEPMQQQDARCASVPALYRRATLQTIGAYVGKTAHALAIQRAPDLVRARGVSAVFVGPAGSGKTTLAAALFREAMAPADARGIFALAWRLGLSRARHPLGQGDPPDYTAAITAPLLVLDDVGTEPGAIPNPVAEAIFERHAEGLPTWITTGLSDAAVASRKGLAAASAAAIASRYGDGIARRIYEGAVVFDCSGQKAGGTP